MQVEQLVGYMAIQQTYARYCRGVDRKDRDLILSTYWPDGYDDHLMVKGKPADVVDWVIDYQKEFTTSHVVGQSLITMIGERQADVETYFQSWSNRPFGDSHVLSATIGRYVDLFEQREGDWRVLNRQVVVDIFSPKWAPSS